MPRKFNQEYECGDPLSGRRVEECLQECSPEARAEVDELCSRIQVQVKLMLPNTYGLGDLAAKEIIGALIRKKVLGWTN
jgi:hypothetical protein